PIALFDGPAAQHPGADGIEVVGTDAIPGRGLRPINGSAGDADARRPVVAVHRARQRVADRGDSGDPRETFAHPLVENRQAFRRLIRRRWIDAHDGAVGWIETEP